MINNSSDVFHIEIVYKFYLYDPKIIGNTLNKWIGPNRKDTFVYKLEKLKEKQLPLLYSKHSKTILETYGLNSSIIKQHVCYKAQLFLPIGSKTNIEPLNSNCIFGSYFNYAELKKYKTYKFYIPKKLDWLITPHSDVVWINFEEAKLIIENFVSTNRSPMIWLKAENDVITKHFVTFW